MRIIKGHKSRSQDEIVEILKRSGAYTCPTLPHYRYGKVKEICRRLRRLDLLRESGRNPESVNLVVTDLFREWATSGSPLGPVRWAKERMKKDGSI